MLSGCTCASDHQYLFPVGLDDAMDIQAEEAARVGMRMTLNRGSMNLSEKDGGLPPDSVVQDEDTILADCERVLDRYHDTGEGAMLQVALAPCAPFTVTKRLMVDSVGLAETHQLPAAHPSRRDARRERILPASTSNAGRSTIWRSAAG